MAGLRLRPQVTEEVTVDRSFVLGSQPRTLGFLPITSLAPGPNPALEADSLERREAERPTATAAGAELRRRLTRWRGSATRHPRCGQAMAGSEPRSGTSSPPPPFSDWGRLEAAILSGWKTFWQSVSKERVARTASREEVDEAASTLTRLPVSVGRRPRRTVGPARAGGTSPGALRGLRNSRAGAWVWLRPCSHSWQCSHREATVDQKRLGIEPGAPQGA